MAAKKKKQTVKVEMDAETLEALVDAASVFSAIAAAMIAHADDPAVKKRLLKRAKG